MSRFSIASQRYRLLLVGVGVFGPCLAAQASNDKLPETLRIYGGEPAKVCEWPTSVGLGGCTGTLVHPRIMLSAAHCSTPRKVQFGEAYGKSIVKTVQIDWCEKNPDFKMVEGDFAFCYLKEAVTDVPIAPIAYGCEVEEVKEGAKIWLVGFGSRDDGGSGEKHKVEIPINKVMKEGQEIEVGGDGKASCYGDSGGPAFMKLSDGSWRTVGIVSRGTNKKCGYPSVLTTAHSAVPWIQKTLKEKGVDDVDIAPCYDDEGNWEPTEECTGFAIDPGTAHGTWDEMCSGSGSKSGKSTICAPEGEKEGSGGSGGEGSEDKPKDESKQDPKKPEPSGKDSPKNPGDEEKEKDGPSDEPQESDDGGSESGQPEGDGPAQSDNSGETEGNGKAEGTEGPKDSGCSLDAQAGGSLFGVCALFGLIALGRRRS